MLCNCETCTKIGELRSIAKTSDEATLVEEFVTRLLSLESEVNYWKSKYEAFWPGAIMDLALNLRKEYERLGRNE